MNVINPEFLPEPGLSREEMEEMQRKVAKKAVFEDSLAFDPEQTRERTVVGIDQAFLDEKVVSAAVAMVDNEIIEKTYAVEKTRIPYIPGLLSFREAEPMVAALEKLSVEPDVLVVDGSGRIHFRQAGIATHVGVIFDMPSIGVAKNLLCGRPGKPVDMLEESARVPVLSDSRMEMDRDILVGYAFQSRQYPESKRINPLYVSPGHRISASTGVDVVEKLCRGYKLPEPTRRADSYVDEVKNSF